MNNPESFVADDKLGVIISTSGLSPFAATTTTKTTKPSLPIEQPDNINDPIARWGDDNDFPDLLDAEIEKNTTLSGAIEKKIDYLYAGGIEYGREVKTNGELTWQYVDDPLYDALLDSPHTQQYLSQAIFDSERYGSFFPEIVFSKDKKTALYLTCQAANDCRWAIQSKLGSVDHCYINKNWELGRKHDSPDTIKVPVIDPLIDTPELIRTEAAVKYIYRTPFASSKTYYPLVPWYSAKVSGVLEVSNKVWAFKVALMTLQMTPKYHIEVTSSWLEKKYGDRYKKATPEEMRKILMEELQHFDEMMKGAEKTGKNIMTVRYWDPVTAQFISAWIITKMEGETFSGAYIPDSEEADTHIQWAVGIDPTSLGSKKSSGMGSGSGSDKREAFNISMSTSQRRISAITSALYFMRNYNGLDPTIKFRMRAPFMQTLNQVPLSQRQNTPQS